MRIETLNAALNYHPDAAELRVVLHLAGGHKVVGIPHTERHRMFSITPTNSDGDVYGDEDGSVIVMDVADIVAVRVFIID